MNTLVPKIQSITNIQKHCENTSIKNPFWGRRSFDINVADSHNVFAYGLFKLVKEHPVAKLASYNVSNSFQQTIRWGLRHPECLQIVNPKIPGAPGLKSIEVLRGIAPQSTIVMLLENEEEGLANYFLKHGANAVISKQAELGEFEDLFEYFPNQAPSFTAREFCAVQNDSIEFFEKLNSLTDRQLLVLKQLKDGKLNKQIAINLKVAEVTIKHHISNLLCLLGFNCRSQLVAMLHSLQFTMQKPNCFGIKQLGKTVDPEDFRFRSVQEYANYGYSLA